MTELPDFSQPLYFLLATLVVFTVVVGRYFLIAGLFHAVFYLWKPVRFQQRKINIKNYKKDQFKKEIKWSMVTALLFAVAGSIMLVLWQKGFTKVYLDVNEYPLWWLPVSLFIAMLLHETYYYWLHRWMHHPRIFKIVHKVINGRVKKADDDRWVYILENEDNNAAKRYDGDNDYKVKRTDDEYKIKNGDYKKEVEKDGDVIIKNGDTKIKIDGETGERKVKRDD